MKYISDNVNDAPEETKGISLREELPKLTYKTGQHGDRIDSKAGI